LCADDRPDDEADTEVTVVRAPDVSVVVAVYNTMPYLTECLESVIGQSIGVDRLEIVAVDDGSTDGSGEELDAWAKRYPGTVTVLHQPNSGGPAQPSNRGIEAATGRYVFFLGADDYLGTEALERLVAAADELDADIVLGRLVGAGGRNVNQAVYADGDRDDIDLVNSPLAWALSNTKLFRRSLLMEHDIRYLESLRSGSDQPFTLRAIGAARRIAVRADYPFYYAVRRTDSSNITYRTSLDHFVRDTAIIMDTTAEVITDPAAREKVLRRHFTWELGKLLGNRFLVADHDEQKRVQEGIRALADTYLSDAIRTSLDVQHRLRLSVAQYGTLDDLVAVARHYVERGLAPRVVEADRWFAALPGFRDPARGFADEWFELTSDLPRLVRSIKATKLAWFATPARRALQLELRSAVPGLDGSEIAVTVGNQQATCTVAPEENPAGWQGTVIRAELPLTSLAFGARAQALPVRVTCTALGETYTTEVTGTKSAWAPGLILREGLRFFTFSTGYDRKHLVVRVNPVGPRRIAGRLLRKLRGR
jgi:glycosyltransferase involved in cell wall biosynthesis